MAALMDHKIPNLKIRIDNLHSDEETKNLEDEDAIEVLNANSDGDVEIDDCEELAALNKRSEGFGTQMKENSRPPIDDTELDNLYKSLGVDKNEFSINNKWGKYRFNAIHIRGVNDMSTEDILDYFKEFGSPSPSVEWINDISCNVVWLEPYSATRAMLAVSKPILRDGQGKISSIEINIAEDGFSTKSTEIVMFTEDDNGLADELAVEEHLPANEEVKTQEEKSATESSVTISNINIPVPPGLWRYGRPHVKSKAIVMRFATKTDRKLPGAEKRSEYYLKYGNPNYGGMRGIISASRKRKYRENIQSKEKKAYSDTEENEPMVTKRFNLPNSQDSNNQEIKKTKKLRMKMYADEEMKKRTRKLDEYKSYSHDQDLRSHLEAQKDRQHSNDQTSSLDQTSSSNNMARVDLRTKLSQKSFNRSKSSRDTGDDLRDKLDLIRQKKKFQHRSPLVIHILEEAKTS